MLSKMYLSYIKPRLENISLLMAILLKAFGKPQHICSSGHDIRNSSCNYCLQFNHNKQLCDVNDKVHFTVYLS